MYDKNVQVVELALHASLENAPALSFSSVYEKSTER